MYVQTVHESRIYNLAKSELLIGEVNLDSLSEYASPEQVERVKKWWSVRQKIKFLRDNLARAANRDNPQKIAVTLDYLYQIGESQNWCCALSGRPLEFVRGGEWGMKNAFGTGSCNPNSCSIDRIDPSAGYVVGNVRLVTSVMNLMRGNLPDKEFISLCKSVVETHS